MVHSQPTNGYHYTHQQRQENVRANGTPTGGTRGSEGNVVSCEGDRVEEEEV